MVGNAKQAALACPYAPSGLGLIATSRQLHLIYHRETNNNQATTQLYHNTTQLTPTTYTIHILPLALHYISSVATHTRKNCGIRGQAYQIAGPKTWRP